MRAADAKELSRHAWARVWRRRHPAIDPTIEFMQPR
jgi:hypothetical protein